MSAALSTPAASSSAAGGTTQPTRHRQQPSRNPPALSASINPPPTYDYPSLRFADIGANLTDEQFTGVYRSKRHHPPDLPAVLARAATHGLSSIFITAGTFDECKEAVQLIGQHQPNHDALRLYTTCGIHPTRARQFASLPPPKLQRLFADMAAYITAHRAEVVAVGECGYDVDRLHFSSLDEQRVVFPHHIRLAQLTALPLFLHDRGATAELLPALLAAQPAVRGVVHSYTSSMEAMLEYVAHGFYIGVNGCSLKTEANLAVVAAIPPDRLLLETDAPWCDIKATHAGYNYVKSRWREVRAEKVEGGAEGVLVKARNEPCKLVCVAEVVAAVRGVSVEELAAQAAENTERLFGLGKLRTAHGDSAQVASAGR